MQKILILILCLFLLTSCHRNPSPITGYIPYGEIPADYSLSDAKRDGLVVYEDSDITAGQPVWDEFVRQAEKGESCAVRLAFYYTLDGQNIDPDYYEEIKDDYPCLYIQDLSFDGSMYTLFSVEETEEYISRYQYLKRFEEEAPGDTAAYSACVRYVLVNDDNVTWEQLIRGMLSSQSGNWIDHKTVYIKYTYKD